MKNKSKVEPITHDEWYKELFKERVTKVPEGFMCVQDIVDNTGFNYGTIQKRLKVQVDKKLMEERIIHNKDGRAVKYYKPIKK